jgi:hypothetical protein
VGLLAPLFLAGAIAVALPIWLHRLQTKSSVRESFSSAMLLESSEQQIHVRRKLQYLLLLAMRIAFLLLLAAAFAQPFLSRPPSALAETTEGTHLVVVDSSVSMGREGLFEQARIEARRVLDSVPDGALSQLIAADDGLKILGDLSPDKNSHGAALGALALSTMRLDFGQFAAELDLYAESLPPPLTLHFVSDYQASGMPLRFSDLVATNVETFTPWPVNAGDGFNSSIEFVRQTADGLDVGIVGNGGTEQDVEVRVLVNETALPTQNTSAQGRQLLRFSGIEFEPGDNRVEVSITADDVLQADNRWYSVVENDPPAPVPLLTAQPGGLAVTYLTAALESAAGNVYQVSPMPVSELDPRVLTRYAWALADDIGALGGPLSDSLVEFLQNGGNLLAFVGERSLALETLPVSGHRLQPETLRGGGDFLSIGQIDTQHPGLAATEGWHRVNVSRTVPLELGEDDQVLVRLDNNEPFIIERRIGAGRLLMVLSSADNRWNDLPLHPVFVSLMIDTAAYLSGNDRLPVAFTTGDSLPLSLIGAASGQVIDPDGDAVLSLAGTAQAQQINLDKYGIYEVYTPQGEALVAVNLDPRESEPGRMSDDVITRWQEATRERDDMAGSERTLMERPPLEIWHWLLLLVALLLIAESLLANRYLSAKFRPG